MGKQHIPMNVLFVCRGNKTNVISPIIRAQAESLMSAGHNITIFPVEGKGKLIYIKNILELRRFIKRGNYDIIHAHFGFSGIMCSFACPERKLIVSLMGSELYVSKLMKRVYRIFSGFFWSRTIVKTSVMDGLLKTGNPAIIPNGVDLDLFHPLEKRIAREKLGLPLNRTILLFPSYTFRKEKNYAFLKKIAARISNTMLLNFNGEPQDVVNLYYNAADTVVMASSFEGSPNVIKEAMACNCPIVATDVGDIKMLTSGTEGCFIADLNEDDYIGKLKSALAFSDSVGRTKGREKIMNLDLDSTSVAKKIICLYHEVIG